MYINQIELKNFRRFKTLKLFFHPLLNIIIAKNSMGKTSILESIYLALNNIGIRHEQDDELINFNNQSAEINLVLSEEQEKERLKLIISRNQSKKFIFNKNSATFNEVKNKMPRAVLFTPTDIEVLTNTPDQRRKYINRLISAKHLDYKTAITNYENALRKRNKLLQNAKITTDFTTQLNFWNSYLNQQAKIITGYRQLLTKTANSISEFYDYNFRLKYHKNEFSLDKAKQLLELELKRGFTLCGPQKDDFSVLLKKDDNWLSVKNFGSRSEQRIAVLWLKKIEIEFLKNHFQPILLIDDLFSELDTENRVRISKFLLNNQTILTSSSELTPNLIEFPKHIIKL
ncbi:MAG: DNA replication and repair protein RecF [Patescibacteria group bacterium]|nr:MAG: DNA replication and repair protein RecF [Patescibacteria group bacterium]